MTRANEKEDGHEDARGCHQAHYKVEEKNSGSVVRRSTEF
jgi:hypothetical protein